MPSRKFGQPDKWSCRNRRPVMPGNKSKRGRRELAGRTQQRATRLRRRSGATGRTPNWHRGSIFGPTESERGSGSFRSVRRTYSMWYVDRARQARVDAARDKNFDSGALRGTPEASREEVSRQESSLLNRFPGALHRTRLFDGWLHSAPGRRRRSCCSFSTDRVSPASGMHPCSRPARGSYAGVRINLHTFALNGNSTHTALSKPATAIICSRFVDECVSEPHRHAEKQYRRLWAQKARRCDRSLRPDCSRKSVASRPDSDRVFWSEL